MTALSRRSFFAALAGALVAAAAALTTGVAKATTTLGHIGVTISANTTGFNAALESAKARLVEFASHPALRFLGSDASVEIDIARDGESEADILERLLDSVVARTERDFAEALAIDAMINEGGRDWS